jgi:hypothetical protein
MPLLLELFTVGVLPVFPCLVLIGAAKQIHAAVKPWMDARRLKQRKLRQRERTWQAARLQYDFDALP